MKKIQCIGWNSAIWEYKVAYVKINQRKHLMIPGGEDSRSRIVAGT